MKLISCDIENFGGLSKFHMDFSEGCNTICGDNGFGKSTLAAFIKVMFYGFDNQNKKDELLNERMRYNPWQGGVYGGKIIFTVKDKSYILSRTFGAKETDDSWDLRDKDTNLPTEKWGRNIGEELFKLDSQSFLRTIFISQNDCDYSITDGISAKLGNLAENTDDINSYEKVDKKLKDILNAMSPKRSTGSLYKINTRIGELEAELRKLPALEKSIQDNEKLLSNAQDEEAFFDVKIKELQEKAIKLNTELVVARERNSIYELNKAEKEQLDRLKTEFKYGTPKLSEIAMWKEYLESCDKLSKAKDRLDLMEEKFEFEKQRAAANKLSVVSGIFAGVFGILAVVLFFIRIEFGLIGTFIAIIFTLVTIFSAQRKKAALDIPPELNKIRENVKEDTNRLAAMENIAYNNSKFTGIKGFVDTFYGQQNYGELSDALEMISHNVELFKELSKKEENYYKNLKEFNEIRLNEELAKVNEGIERLQCQTKQISDNINQYNINLSGLKGAYDEIVSCETELDSLKEQYNEGIDKCRLLSVTKELLGEAKVAFGQKYMEPIKKGFDKYFGMLIGNSEDGYFIDANGTILMEEKGIPRDRRFMSTGYKDLIGICMRMALVDAMYQEERPFIILDDPFVNLDEEKTRGGLELLKEVSKEYQVIYFTCHNSRVI